MVSQKVRMCTTPSFRQKPESSDIKQLQFPCGPVFTGSRTFAALLLCLGVAWAFIPTEYWWHWDIQRYTVQVMIGQRGDNDFSFAHNLLKSWLFHATQLVGLFSNDFQPIQGARWLTIFFSGATAFMLFLGTRSLTRSTLAALVTSALWFTLPANQYLFRELDDNSWSNAFNTLFLVLTLVLAGFSRTRVDGLKRLLPFSFLLGCVLSVGINVHQQLVPNFYAFFVLMCLSSERNWRDTLQMSALFVLGYFGASLIQNFVAFGHLETGKTIRRLYYEPYSEFFPALNFFTSNKSIGDWAAIVLLGWKRAFLIGASRWPAWIALIPLPLLGAGGVVWLARRRGTAFYLYQFRLMLFLSAAFLIHVPHSLMYEPDNIERWDSVLPGLLLLLVWLTHFLFSLRPVWPDRFPAVRRATAVVAACVVLFSLRQAWKINQAEVSGYFASDVVHSLHATTAFLAGQPDASERHVVLLDSQYNINDIQVRITSSFPRITVLTLNKDLELIYSSLDLQGRKGYSSKSLLGIEFPKDCHFSITPATVAWLQASAPTFLESKKWRVVASSLADHDMD